MSLLEEHNNTGSVETGFEQGGAGSPRSDAEIKARDDGTGRKKKSKIPDESFSPKYRFKNITLQWKYNTKIGPVYEIQGYRYTSSSS